MIEKHSSLRRERSRGNARTAIYALGLLLFASLAGNVVLLLSLLRTHDLDAVCVKHTSEYCW